MEKILINSILAVLLINAVSFNMHIGFYMHATKNFIHRMSTVVRIHNNIKEAEVSSISQLICSKSSYRLFYNVDMLPNLCLYNEYKQAFLTCLIYLFTIQLKVIEL